MLVTFKGRPVDITIEGAVIDNDYWCDAYIDEATWEDTGVEFDNDELDEIQDYFHSAEAGEWIINWLF
jgi:hypothetical protein